MAGRLQAQGELPPVYGDGSTDFTIEVHHGGFFYGVGQNRVYLNGQVAWFDGCKAEYWNFMGIEEIILLLDYGFGSPTLKVYWLLPGKNLSDGLRIVCSDEETLIMSQLANRVKNFILYFDHHSHASNNNWEDVVMNPVASLPKVLSPRKVDYIGKQAEDDDGEDSEDLDFYDSDNVLPRERRAQRAVLWKKWAGMKLIQMRKNWSYLNQMRKVNLART
ncbi:unnamed protein product [Urochloa humidicola]